MGNNNTNICFILPSKSSGGTHVVVSLYNAICKIEKSAALYRVSESKFGLLGELIKLFIYFIMSHFSKKEKVFIITEPLQSVIAAITGVNYIRYIQAEDLSLFKNRAYPLGKVTTLIQKFVSIRDGNFLYVSDYVKEKYLSQKKGDNKKILSYKVGPLLDSSFLSFLGEQPKGFDSGKKRKYSIGYMARSSPSKGVDEFCSWMNNTPPQLRERVGCILIISNEVSYSIMKSKLDLNFDVICPTGYRDIASALRDVEVFVFNSKSEGFGLPPLEALMAGAQIVSSKCGGVDEYLDETNSFLFNISDQDDFIEALTKPIIQNVLLNVNTKSFTERFSKYEDVFLMDLIKFIKDEF